MEKFVWKTKRLNVKSRFDFIYHMCGYGFSVRQIDKNKVWLYNTNKVVVGKGTYKPVKGEINVRFVVMHPRWTEEDASLGLLQYLFDNQERLALLADKE